MGEYRKCLIVPKTLAAIRILYVYVAKEVGDFTKELAEFVYSMWTTCTIFRQSLKTLLAGIAKMKAIARLGGCYGAIMDKSKLYTIFFNYKYSGQ